MTNITDEVILKIFLNEKGELKRKNRTSFYYSNEYDTKVIEYLKNRYNDKKDMNMSEIIYRIKNQIDEIPKCIICGTPLPFVKFSKGYRTTFCSNKCKFSEEGKKIWYAHSKETVIKKYNNGVYCENMFQTEYAKKKIKQTLLEKYGEDNPQKIKEFKEKSKNTCLERYGLTNGGWSLATQEKMRKTNLEKWGYEWAVQNPAIQEKIYKSLKQHGTASNLERQFYDYLLTKFSKDDILEQYKDDKYPFFCDFYIKSKEIYIEINGYWTHGDHLFNKNNPDDLALLEKWAEKASEEKPNLYNVAIYVWTNLDVKKYNIAKVQKINFIPIYGKTNENNIKIFEEYLNNHNF